MFGERRLRAARDILGWQKIPARVVRVTSLLKGEREENEVRKDFTISERVAIGKALEAEIGNRKGQRTDLAPRENFPQVDSHIEGVRTSQTAARFAGFGNRKTYEQAKSVIERGAPKLVEAVDKKLISVSRAKRMLDLSSEEQSRIGKECIQGRNSRQVTKTALRQQNKYNSAGTGMPSMTGLPKVAVVLADPLRASQRDGQNQCDASELSKIKALGDELAEHLLSDAVLFLWAPGALIAEALEVVKAWGFKYRAQMVWMESQIEQGDYVQYYDHKLLVIGARGNPLLRKAAPPSSVMVQNARDIIELMYPDSPKLSLFGRIDGACWSSWGDVMGNGAEEDEVA